MSVRSQLTFFTNWMLICSSNDVKWIGKLEREPILFKSIMSLNKMTANFHRIFRYLSHAFFQYQRPWVTVRNKSMFSFASTINCSVFVEIEIEWLSCENPLIQITALISTRSFRVHDSQSKKCYAQITSPENRWRANHPRLYIDYQAWYSGF